MLEIYWYGINFGYNFGFFSEQSYTGNSQLNHFLNHWNTFSSNIKDLVDKLMHFSFLVLYTFYTSFPPVSLPYSILGVLGVSVLGRGGRGRRGCPYRSDTLASTLPWWSRSSVGPVGGRVAVVGSLLGLGSRGWGAQSGVQLAQGAVPPLAVLFERLRLHHLTTVAAHHQVEVVVARVQAEDGHVCEESGKECVKRKEKKTWTLAYKK